MKAAYSHVLLDESCIQSCVTRWKLHAVMRC